MPCCKRRRAHLHLLTRSSPSPMISRTLHRALTTSTSSLRQRLFSTTAIMYEASIDQDTLKQYLADDPPTIVPLSIKPHFEALNNKEKKYAHYISRAAFAGTRVNLRQVSPESEKIYDFILALHKACNGELSLINAEADLILISRRLQQITVLFGLVS